MDDKNEAIRRKGEVKKKTTNKQIYLNNNIK